MIKFKILITVLILFASPVFSQIYDAIPCDFGPQKSKNNQRLQSLLKNNLKELDLWEPEDESYANYYSNWSSSILKPDGISPKKQVSFYVEGFGEETTYTRKYILFSCKYSAFSMFDNNSETAWSEGAEGDGIGEYTLARIDITKPIKIWNGFGKSNELFLKNNRIKDATVYVLLSKCESPAVNAKVFSNFVFLDKFNLVFKDINEFQEFKIPDSILDSYAKIKNKVPDKQNCSFGNFYTPFIAIQIDSVYKGSMYSDTLITEIKN